MLLAAAPLLVAAATAPLAQVRSMSPEEAAESLRQCGLAGVTAIYDEDLQDHELVVADGEASDAELECAAEVALDSRFWVSVIEPLHERYFARYQRLARERARSDARALLAAQNRLDRVPEYIPGRTEDAAFARQLEALCGEEAEGALQSAHGPHALSPDLGAAPADDFERHTEALACLITYAAAAGFDLGFIGNESAPAD